MLLYAIRHGETDWNLQGRIQGQLDVPLNALGRAQAQAAARALAAELAGRRPTALLASDLERAYSTAQAIGTALGGLPAQVELRLRERRFGIFQGLSFDEVEARHPEAHRQWRERVPGFAPPGGGESLESVHARVAAVLADCVRWYGDDDEAVVILVAHGGVLDSVYRLAHGIGLDAPRGWRLSNCTLNRLRWHRAARAWAVESWDDTAHLRGLDAELLDAGADLAQGLDPHGRQHAQPAALAK
jgi:probable phosphoglycerate mutase